MKLEEYYEILGERQEISSPDITNHKLIIHNKLYYQKYYHKCQLLDCIRTESKNQKNRSIQ